MDLNDLILENKEKIPSYIHRSMIKISGNNSILQDKVMHELYKKKGMEDITQDVLLKICRYGKTFDSSKPFNPWLNSVVKTVCIDFINKNINRFSSEMESPQGSWDNYNFYSGHIVDYNSLLNQLSESLPLDHRKIFKGYYIDGKTQEKISEDLNLGLRTVNRIVKNIKEVISNGKSV